jgi:glutamate-1-semialdehyde 2,1-aminomutase
VEEDFMDARPAADSMTRSLGAAARRLAKRELVRYILQTPGSERAMARAERVLPLGVASSFQFYEPHPLVMRKAEGALLTGHGHPALRRAVTEQLERGTLFVSPCEDNAVVAELLASLVAEEWE